MRIIVIALLMTAACALAADSDVPAAIDKLANSAARVVPPHLPPLNEGAPEGWDAAHPASKVGAANKLLTGHSSALPDTYGLTVEELVDLMNRMKDDYSSTAI